MSIQPWLTRGILAAALAILCLTGPTSAQNAICPTAPNGDSSNKCASTAFVQNALGGGGGSQSANTVFAGPSSGPAASPTFRPLVGADLPNGTTGSGAVVLADSPALTGIPTAPTAAAMTDTTQLATTAFVTQATRERLASNLTLYVRTDGSDTLCNGRANAAAASAPNCAWLTLQKSWDFLSANIDAAGYIITVQVADGTYTAGIVMNATPGGFVGKVRYVGNTSTPSNVLISTANTTAILGIGTGLDVDISGFKVAAASAPSAFTGIGIFLSGQSAFYVSNMDFGVCAGGHIVADTGGFLALSGTYTISGNAPHHLQARTDGLISLHGPAVTLTGTPAFSRAFATTESIGRISSSATWSGAATGVRYEVSNGIIQVGTNISKFASETYFPGNAAGRILTGGSYLWGVYDVIQTYYREKLFANRTYFVRTDGSDTLCDGLVNAAAASTPSCAFLTIQKAVDTVAAIDISTFTVTIRMGNTGTYTGNVRVNAPWIGTGDVILQGDTVTPTNTVIANTGSVSAIQVSNGGRLQVQSFRVGTTGGGSSIVADNATIKNLGGIDFAAAAFAHWAAVNSGYIYGDYASGSYTISGGNVAGHFYASLNGTFYIRAITITLSGTPAIGTGFVAFDGTSTGFLDSITFVGSATGKRFNVVSNSSVAANGSATYFPGNAGGTIASGGRIDLTTVPAISGCGTTPGAATGTDFSGRVTEGTTATGCTITFATASVMNSCSVNISNATAQAGLVITTLGATLVVTHPSVSGAVLYWNCQN